jgi:hypothetical protein
MMADVGVLAVVHVRVTVDPVITDPMEHVGAGGANVKCAHWLSSEKSSKDSWFPIKLIPPGSESAYTRTLTIGLSSAFN